MQNIQQEKQISCPYCAELISLQIDCSVESQEYIEDCFVCCRPIRIVTQIDNDENLTLCVYHEDE